MKTLIRNGTILTMDSPQPGILRGDVGIDGSIIAFVGECPASFVPERSIDANDCIVMPGLVNAHTHLAMSLMRHYADDLPFWNWLFERIVPVEARLTKEFVHDGTMLSLVEMLRGGITTFADMYFNMDVVAEATLKAGLRGNLTRGLAFNGPDDLFKLDESREFHQQWHGAGDGRIQVDIGPHAVYTCPPAYLEKVIALADQLDARIHIHLSESRKEVADCKREYGKSPVAHVRDLGLFSRKTLAAHCVHIDDDDIRIFSECGVGVAHNPGSNLKLANGFAPVSRLLAAGVAVGLGTDGSASNNNLNMFEEMNLAAFIAKGVTEDPTAVSAYTALRMATIDGARVLGLDAITGSLKAGKKADVILVDTTAPHFYPRNSVAASLVYAAQASDVRTVFCDGELLIEDRQLKRLDQREICIKAQESAARLTGSAGFIA